MKKSFCIPETKKKKVIYNRKIYLKFNKLMYYKAYVVGYSIFLSLYGSYVKAAAKEFSDLATDSEKCTWRLGRGILNLEPFELKYN